jgi:hypothetical protein
MAANTLNILKPSVNNLTARAEETLGDAYSEPVADVRGYIEYARSK